MTYCVLTVVPSFNVVTQFFGFKNPFVQRLLRELVANINRAAEQSLPSASFCNRATGSENDTRFLESCTHPDLLPYLEKPLLTGKRSRKQKNKKTKLISGSTHKRLRPRELTDNSVASSSRQRNCDGEYSLASPLMVNMTVVSIQLSEKLIPFQPEMLCLWKLLALLIILERKPSFIKRRESLLVLKIICPLELLISLPLRENL